jgi:hypothetical protein
MKYNTGDYEKTHFCNFFLQAVHNIVPDSKYTFFTDEAWVGTSVLKTIGTGAVIM